MRKMLLQGMSICQQKNELIPPDVLLQNLRLKNNERILIAHLNINSIPNKIGLLEDLVHNRLDILLVSETKINNSSPTDFLLILLILRKLRFSHTIYTTKHINIVHLFYVQHSMQELKQCL